MDTEKKKDLLQILIDKMTSEADLVTESIESEHRAIKEAPGANKSWSDTTRSQKEGLLKGKINLLADLRNALFAIENLKARIMQMEIVQLGAVVETQSKKGKQEIYLIVPGGGEKIAFESKEIILLSYSSPLAKALKGHRKGDCVKVQVPAGTRTLTILDVS